MITDAPDGLGGTLDKDQYEQWRRLVRISLSGFEAERMAKDGWTVERVAESTIEELTKHSHSSELSETWKSNAIRLLDQSG